MSTETKSAPLYLRDTGRTIQHTRYTDAPRYGYTADGYTVRAGAPTRRMVRLEGETRWRRVYVWQFSNAGTAFLRIGGEPFIVTDEDFA
jgi:hypothetical protein